MNPFEIKTPEQNTAQDVVDLFVDVFADFKQVLEKGHTFLNGPRGSGKSMMFRYIMPDCQMIAHKCKPSELDFFAAYIPIKLTNINIPDLDRLENHASTIFNEHLLATYIVAKIFVSLLESYSDELNTVSSEINKFYQTEFIPIITQSGYSIPTDNYPIFSGEERVRQMSKICDSMNRECLNYCKRIALSRDITSPYSGSIVDFMDFVYPIIMSLKSLSIFPSNKPFFLLVDDAGYLNLTQTKILNTWVSYRTTRDVCFKISTQLDYKSHLTINDKRIDSPHDYSEINISTVYSSRKSQYNERIKEIVLKRLKKYLNVPIIPTDFFPSDKEQDEKIESIYEEIKKSYNDPQKPYVAGDAARRYARPEFIRQLQQIHKSGAHYSYAGFDQLVAISSGIIRHFLAPAQEMYALESTLQKTENLTSISSSVQDEIIKKYSTAFLTDEFDKLKKDVKDSSNHLADAEKLFNLIDSLGELFHRLLVSEISERRVFSIALTDRPDEELQRILDMGEQFGYLHKSTIGNKSGTGRNTLYILSRILAPHFKLDPTSFAGYKFMSSSTLSLALKNKRDFLNRFKKQTEDNSKYTTPSLFDYE